MTRIPQQQRRAVTLSDGHSLLTVSFGDGEPAASRVATTEKRLGVERRSATPPFVSSVWRQLCAHGLND